MRIYNKWFITSRSGLRWPAVTRSEAMFFHWLDQVLPGQYAVTLEDVR